MAEARRDWILVAILLAVLAAVMLLLAPRGQRVTLDSRLTTYRTTPDGAGALYQTLTELGVPVDRSVAPLAGVAPIRGPLAVLSPTEPLSPTERDSLLAWVDRGGRLILALRPRTSLGDSLGLAAEWAGSGDAARVAPAAAGVGAVGVEADARGRGLEPGADVAGWVAGMDTVARARWVFRDTLALARGDARPLLVQDVEDADRSDDTASAGAGPLPRRWLPTAVLLRRGAGLVLALSDPAQLANAQIRDDGVAPLVVRVAAAWAGPDRPLRFDEYHHGYRGGSPSRALGTFLVRAPAGRVLLQLALVALLALVPVAVRLGAPRPPRLPERRSPVEHVSALGEVYRQARAVELARRRLLVGFARRIGRDRPAPGQEAEFLDRLGRHVPAGGEAVAAVAAAWNDRLGVLELARRIDRAVTRLNRTQ